tara:strand:+ start:636 stop:1226 length:591 start_codon:yes stop_codon:yes gene_type:complete
MKLSEKLSVIQTSINVKKTQRNNFGKYNYRTIDDIIEALKPHLSIWKCSFHFEEQIIFNDHMPIIKVNAILMDCESLETIVSTGIAGIDLNQKGMSTPQQFGSAGTYARKYAAGNLFLFDDNTDPDSQDNTHKKPTLTKSSPKFQKYVEWVSKGNDKKKDLEKMQWLKDHYEMSGDIFDNLMSILDEKEKRSAGKK